MWFTPYLLLGARKYRNPNELVPELGLKASSTRVLNDYFVLAVLWIFGLINGSLLGTLRILIAGHLPRGKNSLLVGEVVSNGH